MNKKSAYLLMDEYPLLIFPSLAVAVGLNEAIVLQQINYWVQQNKRTNRNFRAGYYWTYGTYSYWQKQFPWWPEITVKRIFLSLEKSGYLVSDYFNTSKMDRTKWYRIDYGKLDTLSTPYQIDTVGNINLIQIYTETNTETNNGNNGSIGYADRTAHSCICVPKVKKSDESISEFMEWYFTLYRQMKGEEHPPIKSAQRIRVHDTLKNFCIENEMDADGLKVMAESFFDVSTSDHNINHFATAGILENRFYETLY